MENICGIRCSYNEAEALDSKKQIIEKTKKSLRTSNVFSTINSICVAGMVVMLIVFAWMWAYVKFVDGKLFFEWYSYILTVGIIFVSLLIISSCCDFISASLSSSLPSDLYGIAEYYLTAREKGDRIVDAKITVDKDNAVFHLFVEWYDDIYGKVIHEKVFSGIRIVETTEESFLDINHEIYYMKKRA